MYPYLDLGVFMSYLCHLFFIFIFIFIVINCMNTGTHVLLLIFPEYVLLFLDDNVDEECTFDWALLIKVLLIKKAGMLGCFEFINYVRNWMVIILWIFNFTTTSAKKFFNPSTTFLS